MWQSLHLSRNTVVLDQVSFHLPPILEQAFAPMTHPPPQPLSGWTFAGFVALSSFAAGRLADQQQRGGDPDADAVGVSLLPRAMFAVTVSWFSQLSDTIPLRHARGGYTR